MGILKNSTEKKYVAKSGTKIAYHQLQGDKAKPGVVFLGGFMSDMKGTKAVFLEKACEKLDVSYIRFDYYGHGQSSGRLQDGNLSHWKQDVLSILDELTQGPQILIGSSMGGWLMVLAALERIERIVGLIGIAAAADFIKDFSLLTLEQQATLRQDGICFLPSRYGDPYPITQQLLEDGMKHCILENPVNIGCPVRLLHGMNDEQVSWEQSFKLANCLESRDIILTLLKGGDHRLSKPHELQILEKTLSEMIGV